MTLASELPPDASLSELLGARAARTPADRLAIDIIGGALVAGVATWARPAGWVVLVTAALCLAAYGTWAVAQRRLQPVPWPEHVAHEALWRSVRGTAAFVGLAAFIVLLFACLGVALGRIIS